MNKVLFIFIIISVLFGCKKENDVLLNSATPNQKVFFEFELINFAWGKQHQGWFIDSSGNIFTYRNPAEWVYADTTGEISESEMAENLSKTNLSTVTINKHELYKKVALIEKASRGAFGNRGQAGADMGAWCYYAYTFDPQEKVYKRHLLSQTGDWQISNLSREAAELAAWLAKIQPPYAQ